MAITNVSAGVPLDGWMIQFNKNALGLAPTSQQMQLDPGAQQRCVLGCAVCDHVASATAFGSLQHAFPAVSATT